EFCHRHRACTAEPVGLFCRSGAGAGVLRSRGGSLRAAQAAAVRYRPVYPGFAGLRPGADPGMAAGGALCPGPGRLWWHGGQPGGGARPVLADRVGAGVLQADAGHGHCPHLGAAGRWLVGGWLGLCGCVILFHASVWLLVWLRLPETLPADAPRSRLSGALGSYARLLRAPEFMFHALTGGLAMAGMFAYIAGSPFVFIQL